MADAALDIFWQARRCGESWNTLTPTDDFLSVGDKLGPEATSTTAFKQFMFDLIREMLSDIYQVSTQIQYLFLNIWKSICYHIVLVV